MGIPSWQEGFLLKSNCWWQCGELLLQAERLGLSWGHDPALFCPPRPPSWLLQLGCAQVALMICAQVSLQHHKSLGTNVLPAPRRGSGKQPFVPAGHRQGCRTGGELLPGTRRQGHTGATWAVTARRKDLLQLTEGAAARFVTC